MVDKEYEQMKDFQTGMRVERDIYALIRILDKVKDNLSQKNMPITNNRRKTMASLLARARNKAIGINLHMMGFMD
jgi:hypothetical protein